MSKLYYTKEMIEDRYSRNPPLSNDEIIIGILGNYGPTLDFKTLAELIQIHNQLGALKQILRENQKK